MVYDKEQKTVQACFLLSICRHNNLASLTHLLLISSLRGFFFFNLQDQFLRVSIS